MSTAVAELRYTPEDLLEMPDAVDFELVDGRLVERKMSGLSSLVGMTLGRRLGHVTDESGLGDVFGADCSYQCFSDDRDKVRKPDVSFIAKGRLPVEQLVRGHIRIAPDLAVEVVSPNEPYYHVDDKVQEYRDAGVRLIWIVNPESRSVLVHRRDGTTDRLTENDELGGEDVVPGFRCRVEDLFPPPEVSAAAKSASSGNDA